MAMVSGKVFSSVPLLPNIYVERSEELEELEAMLLNGVSPIVIQVCVNLEGFTIALRY